MWGGLNRKIIRLDLGFKKILVLFVWNVFWRGRSEGFGKWKGEVL